MSSEKSVPSNSAGHLAAIELPLRRGAVGELKLPSVIKLLGKPRCSQAKKSRLSSISKRWPRHAPSFQRMVAAEGLTGVIWTRQRFRQAQTALFQSTHDNSDPYPLPDFIGRPENDSKQAYSQAALREFPKLVTKRLAEGVNNFEMGKALMEDRCLYTLRR
jgi:hypothetical protein